MTRSARRRIFYVLLALFFVIGGGVAFYADGWRLDFASWRFEKVGGIYVRAYPESASILLDGKSVQNQSGFLTQGTLISDLLPRTYNVALKAPGYDIWQENASVLPSLVVQFKYAVLIPRDGVPASSTAATATASMTSPAIDPYDANIKIVAGKNKISTFDIAQTTTTASTTISGKNVAVKWIDGGTVGILQNDGELYLYDAGGGTLQKLADDVKNFAATPDGSLVAALEQKSLEIFSRSDPSAYYRFNLPDIASAAQVIWYRDQSHLFVVYPDRVSFLDLADTSLINFATVARGTSPTYDVQTNSLYIKTTLNKTVRYDFPS